MAFLDTPRFPDDIAYGSQGGPMYKTAITVMASGREQRNITWGQARHKYDVSYGVRDQASLDDLLSFFHAVLGAAHSFRYKDFSDFHTATPSGYGADGAPSTAVTKDDQHFGSGDAILTEFQITKTYTKGVLDTVRNITKPIDGTVLIAVDGVLQTEGGGSDYTIDYTTGIITFVSPPGDGLALTWGGEFDVPVRFESDTITTKIDNYLVGNISVDLIEVRV
jgi:uncharacterized protein (TIGR02217 family)